MLTFSIVVSAFVLLVYFTRRRFRRALYILWTGDEKPDWLTLYQKWYGERWKEFAEQDNKR